MDFIACLTHWFSRNATNPQCTPIRTHANRISTISNHSLSLTPNRKQHMLFSLNSRSFLLCFVVMLLPRFVFNYIVEYSKCIYRFVTIFDLGLCSMNFDKHSLNPIPSSIHTSRVYLYIHRNQTHVSWLYQQWTLENVVCKSSESINQCTCSLLIKLLY